MGAILTGEPKPVCMEWRTRGALDEIARWPLDRGALTLALAAVPISIALSEILLSVSLAARVALSIRRRRRVFLPRVFWIWLLFAVLVLVSWLLSPDLASGWSEIRRLGLVAALFFVVPSLNDPAARLKAWKGVFMASGVSSAFLICDFIGRYFHYERELSVGGAAELYLRTGGLISHWMVFASVEILIVAGLITFWSYYPEERARWAPIFVLNGVAIVLTLTRSLWLAAFLLVMMELMRRRSKWIWLVPAFPVALWLLAPGPVRSRILESTKPEYYSNQERVQMLKVGYKLILAEPLTGVGGGRISQVYRQHLEPGDPVPAYHGHLHNNFMQMAATQGIPVALASVLFAGALLVCLIRSGRRAGSRPGRFESEAGILALIGFSFFGLFDYSYGHSLALILLCFAVFSPLSPDLSDQPR